MSQKIKDVLSVIEEIKTGASPGYPIKNIRRDAIKRIAQKRKVEPNTIADAYLRRLRPFIKNTAAFDVLIEQWLSKKSNSLKNRLFSACIDDEDPVLIRNFFS